MPWQEDRHERTEAPSPRRRERAKEKGQVAKSREVASVAILMTGPLVFYFFGQGMVQSLNRIMNRFILESGSMDLNQEGLYILLKTTLVDISYLLMPILFLPLVGVMANMMQVGFLFTAEPLTPNLSRINPVEGVKRLFSSIALVELIKGILMLVIVGYVAYITIRGEMDRLALLTDMDIPNIILYLGSSTFNIILRAGGVLLILAILDYAFQRWRMERDLRMTRYEVKEEFKETEGQPLVRSRIKSLQRRLARQRMMQEVPKATVVITNPAHLAIALKYDQGRMRAPVVVAKGAGLIAERIKEIARSHGIPLMEDRPLAQTLWKMVDVGKEIPTTLYKAVAEILAYVYRIKARG